MRLTYDHKPTDVGERLRLVNQPGGIINNRVGGMYSVSRTLGNHDYTDGFSLKPFLISVPYTSRTELTEEDEFLILASDGVSAQLSGDTIPY